MEQLEADAFTVVAVVFALLFMACVGIFAALRYARSRSDRLVPHSLQCPYYREAAVVTFVERLPAGLPLRRVQSCSLLGVGARCSEACTGHAIVWERARGSAAYEGKGLTGPR